MLWAVNSNGDIVREYLEEQDDGGKFVGVFFLMMGVRLTVKPIRSHQCRITSMGTP
jgi:hypothetical protein